MAKKQKHQVEQSTNEVVAQVEAMVEQTIEPQVVETQVAETQVVETQVAETQVVETQVAETQVVVNKVHRDKGIGQRAKTLIVENPTLSNMAIAALVKIEFPDAATTDKCIAWYKSKMRKNGELGPRVLKSQVVQPQVVEPQVEEVAA